MKIVRVKVDNEIKYGVLEQDAIRIIKGSPFDQFTAPGCSFEFDGTTYKLEDVQLLSPCTPFSKVVCIGLNHWSMIEEGMAPPPNMVIFVKPSTAVIGPEESIELPPTNRHTNSIGYEGELGAVIGRTAKRVSEEKAKEYILGYTCHNDVSDYDAIKTDGISLTRGKGQDTFAPVGPFIETNVDGDNLLVESYLNGELGQSGSTNELIHNVSKLVAFMSGVMTLLPGDVVSTGTPKKSNSRLKHGDVIEIKIEGIGTLRNHVVQI